MQEIAKVPCRMAALQHSVKEWMVHHQPRISFMFQAPRNGVVGRDHDGSCAISRICASARLIACSECNPEATRRWLRTEAAKICGVPSDWQVTNPLAERI